MSQWCRKAEIYRWSIILADTDFFQQSVSVSAADFRGRNNRPSAKHFFIKLSAKQFSCSWAFWSLCQPNKTSKNRYEVEKVITYFIVRKKYGGIKKKKKNPENFPKIFPKFFYFLKIILLFRNIGICFGNRPIADFFHDQTIFLKDYELYIIGHSL